jgi:hypothetical protein
MIILSWILIKYGLRILSHGLRITSTRTGGGLLWLPQQTLIGGSETLITTSVPHGNINKIPQANNWPIQTFLKVVFTNNRKINTKSLSDSITIH